jgi:hypothetical protein
MYSFVELNGKRTDGPFLCISYQELGRAKNPFQRGKDNPNSHEKDTLITNIFPSHFTCQTMKQTFIKKLSIQKVVKLVVSLVDKRKKVSDTIMLQIGYTLTKLRSHFMCTCTCNIYNFSVPSEY